MKECQRCLCIFILLAVMVSFTGCSQNIAGTVTQEPVRPRHSAYDLAISERSFYIGVVPTPKTVPSTTFEDITAAYEEAGDIGEVAMVWVTSAGIGQYDKLKQSNIITAFRVYGVRPVVTLGFATIRQVPGEGLKYVVDAPAGVNADLSDPEFRRRWVDEAGKIARDFKPEYFSLGNEINDYFYLHPDGLDDYVSLYDEAYAAIKDASPDTKVFVVFSYDHLIENDQYDLLALFDSRADLIGLTTYPWNDYDTPQVIPDDYYGRLGDYTSKPIAFTEIGWISSAEKGSSEKEQAEFLVRFLHLTRDLDIEMVNWLLLHETGFTGESAAVFQPEAGTIALKRADGSQKEIYGVWLDLYDLGNAT
ncbi:MAG: Glycosyl hydrolase family 53 [Methanocella sp. PtaU1.Bin125]|nr:MAG: Glycosyl hydrolase family 53 [Methanocella sp. PtaU1.Bin125]